MAVRAASLSQTIGANAELGHGHAVSNDVTRSFISLTTLAAMPGQHTEFLHGVTELRLGTNCEIPATTVNAAIFGMVSQHTGKPVSYKSHFGLRRLQAVPR
jgi:hypothetical protein